MFINIKRILCLVLVFVAVLLVPFTAGADSVTYEVHANYAGAAITSMNAPSTDYSPKAGEYYCKEALSSANQRRFYGALVSLLSNYPVEQLKTEFSFSIVFENVSTYALTEKELILAVYCVFNDHPEFFWFYNASFNMNFISSKSTSTITINVHASSIYSSDAELIKDATAFLLYADAIVMDAPKKGTYEIIKYLNDWLCENNKYNTPAATGVYSRANTAVSALVSDNEVETGPVCQGYAGAFKYLCDRLGINCVMILGSAYDYEGNKGGHAWNAVKIDNNWYALDITWNDSISCYDYFLVGSNTLTRYNANKSYDQFGENHITDRTNDLLIPYYPELSKVAYLPSAEYRLKPLEEYSKISISNDFVYGLSDRLTVAEVVSMFMYFDHVGIIYDGNDLIPSEIVGTGSVIYIMNDNNKMVEDAEIVIKGDINGDGRVTTLDYLKVKKQFGEGVSFTGAIFKAADIDDNGNITTGDYLKIKRHFDKTYDLYK